MCESVLTDAAADTWTLRKKDNDKVQALKTKCFRGILNIRRQQKIRNKEVTTKIAVTYRKSAKDYGEEAESFSSCM